MFICNFISYLLILLYINYYISVNSADEEIKLLKDNNTILGKLLFGTIFYLVLAFMLLLIRILVKLVGVTLPSAIILFVTVAFILIIEFIKNRYDNSEEWFKLEFNGDNIILKLFNMYLTINIKITGKKNE